MTTAVLSSISTPVVVVIEICLLYPAHCLLMLGPTNWCVINESPYYRVRFNRIIIYWNWQKLSRNQKRYLY